MINPIGDGGAVRIIGSRKLGRAIVSEWPGQGVGASKGDRDYGLTALPQALP